MKSSKNLKHHLPVSVATSEVPRWGMARSERKECKKEDFKLFQMKDAQSVNHLEGGWIGDG